MQQGVPGCKPNADPQATLRLIPSAAIERRKVDLQRGRNIRDRLTTLAGITTILIDLRPAASHRWQPRGSTVPQVNTARRAAPADLGPVTVQEARRRRQRRRRNRAAFGWEGAGARKIACPFCFFVRSRATPMAAPMGSMGESPLRRMAHARHLE